jgi:hypothetical protein
MKLGSLNLSLRHLIPAIGMAIAGICSTAMAGALSLADDAKQPVAASAGPKIERSVPRGAVITMGERGEKDMVGVFMTAEILKRMIPLLEEEQVDIVVLRFYSGGGALIEIKPLSDTIHFEYKKRFKTVGWIESAISAAAMTAHCIEDIYFTSQGNYGGCTGFSGRLNAMKGRGLEEVLIMMEMISERGGKDPKIMRAMQIDSAPDALQRLQISAPDGSLSANIDENGDVKWFQDTTSGKYVVNPTANGTIHILTFTSEQAERFKFSRGTADTLDELTAKMGYKEIEWVGEKTKGSLWPISKAEKINMAFRAKTHKDQELFNSYWRNYQFNIAAARGEQDRQARGPYINKARQELENIKRMVRNNPNLALFQMNMLMEEFKEWLAEQEKFLRELSK